MPSQTDLAERIARTHIEILRLQLSADSWLENLLHRSTLPLFLAGPQSRRTGRARIQVDAVQSRGRKGPLRYAAERRRRGHDQQQNEKDWCCIFAARI